MPSNQDAGGLSSTPDLKLPSEAAGSSGNGDKERQESDKKNGETQQNVLENTAKTLPNGDLSDNEKSSNYKELLINVSDV